MLRKKLFVQSLVISWLIFCAAVISPAQPPAADKNQLAKFEKSIEQGDYALIERDLLNYAIRHPNDAPAIELLARMRLDQNRLNEARSLYQKVLSLDPNFTFAKINLAVINFQTGNSQQALSALDEISDREITGDALRLKLANTFALVGDCRKALTAIEKLSLKIKNGDALPLRAKCYFETGEKPQINALLPLANGLVRQNPATAVKLADVLIGGAMFKESADLLRAVVKIFPQKADALILLAKAEIYLKDFAGAKTHLAQASKINPASPDLFFVQGLLESEQGKNAESLALLEKSLAAAPNSTAFLRQYVISAIRASENGKAVKAAERLIQLNPNEPEFLYLHGAASLQNNNLKAAETSLTKYFEIRPQDPRGCVALGLVFAAQADKLDVARRQMEKCIEINPNNTEAKYQLGLSYKAAGETAKAIEYFEATVRDAPNYASALRDLGASYMQTGAEAKARVALEKSVALQADDADTHFQLSRLYNLLGETALAKKHLEIFQKLKNPKKDGM
jgi:tetratricopeptide (TPR) repeat protein